MAKKRKKKPPHDATEPKGKMLPAEGAAGRADDAGTRIDDGARHVFFSFKGELKSDLPDATETDLAGNLGITPPEETATSDASASEPDVAEPDAKAPEPAADATAAEPDAHATSTEHGTADVAKSPEADATAADTALESAATPHDEHEQSRAGPVRGPDPAATEKTASQSRKAAGPAHFTPPAEAPRGDSGAAAPPAPETPEAIDAATHTDVRGEPFAPSASPTRTEIDAQIFASQGESAETTRTEFEAVGPKAGKTPPVPSRPETPGATAKPAEPRPASRRVAAVGDESAVGSETMLDASGRTPTRPGVAAGKPKDETAAGSETILDAAARAPAKPRDEAAPGSETMLDAVARAPAKPKDETAAGSETIVDIEGARGGRGAQEAATRTGDEAAARTGADAPTTTSPEVRAAGEVVTRTEPDADAAPRYAGPDADTATKEPPATATEARATATDVASAAAPEAPSFHDAETDSQPFDAIAGEAVPAEQEAIEDAIADSTTEPFAEAPPAAFAGPLFDAPVPTEEAPAQDDRPVAPRRRRRRSDRPQAAEPVLKRLARWARHRLDPRDFLEIIGTAIFERATKLGEKVRTARRQNRVAHTAGWWRQTLVELSILWAIVIPIELAVSGGRLGSFGVHPHPYWLIVLPLAAARGLVAGLLAAVIASCLYAIGAAQAVTGDLLFTFRNMTEPLLFFAVAFFAGELHDEGFLRRRKLDRRIQDLEERTEQLRQQRDVLTDANRELEKRIVDDSVQFGNLIQAARRIERAGRQEVFDLALQMAEEHCGAAASVLILLDDGSLDYLCHRGWPSEEVGKRLGLARESAFVKRAVSDGVSVNGLDPTEVAPPQGPLVVAPLFDAGGVVKAIMCLDEIPLARLNESTVTVFLGIADWASAALARLTRGGDAPAPRTAALSVGPEVDLWLGTVADLGKRLRIELSRCSRYGVPTSFLTIQAADWKDATREGIDALDRFMLMHFTTGLRPSDGIYRFGYPGAYLLVLAGTALKGAEVVRTRLERRISYTPSQVGEIEIRATGPDAEAPDLVSLVSRAAKGFRERSKLPLDARCPVTIPERMEAEDLNAFLRRLKMETSLAVRNGFDLHVVGISAEASEQAGPGILARHVVEVGEQTLRPTDGVYMIGQYQCAIVLPSTNGEEAATVAHRLATLVRARDPSAPYGQIETQVLGLGPIHPDAGSFLTALARRAKGGAR